MEIVLSIIALVVGAIAIAQVASLRRENREVLDELKALRTAVDAFEAPARGESAETVVTVPSNGGAAASPAPAPAVVAEVKAPAASSDIPAHILAVIAASVAGTLRGQYRILAIQAANAAQQVSISIPVVDWSLEGRREIYSSHKLR
ncbi:MAG: hypothetical protein B9S32_17110 [Verrucomicrobia bacterium Tous-C9LFEB]|nr:MAG: hypothetical protein B9S32_17110 [Verrucomicrobia bacterium Tous-C9LFEB]